MWLIVGLIVGLILLFALWQNKTPPKAVIEMANGIVKDDPQSLADARGVDLETYSLARVAQSEEGMSGDRAKIAVMFATLNHATATGKSITEIVTKGNPKRSDYDLANGRYGRQGIHPYCSTIANPTDHTIDLARSVMDLSAQDETEGSQYWDNPVAQDVLHLTNPYNESTGKGYRSSAEIAAIRSQTGTLVTIDGISTRFWK